MSTVPKKGFVKLKGSYGPSSETSTKLGPTEGNEIVEATIYLRRRVGHEPLPDLRTHKLHTPHTRMSNHEFASKYGASQDDIELVKGFCLSAGLEVIEEHSARRQVKISGTVDQFNAVFSLDIHNYTKIDPHKKKKVTFRAHEDIAVPASLSDVIMGVFGIGTEPIYQAHIRAVPITPPLEQQTPIGFAVSGIPTTTTGFQFPQQQGSLYNFPTTSYSLGGVSAPNGFIGTGQTIGLIAVPGDGYVLRDVRATFAATNQASTLPPGAAGYPRTGLGYAYLSTGDTFNDGPNVPALSITDVLIGGAKNPGNTGGSVETLLDICQVLLYSTTANVAVYFLPDNTANFNDAYSRMVHPNPGDPICTILSFSFGATEHTEYGPTFAVSDSTFQDAAALGITILAASGDWGSADPHLSDTKAHVFYPASSPWVTGVGGTVIGNVGINNTSQAVTSSTSFTEWVWNETASNTNAGATGGGVSILYPVPSYQASVVIPVEVDTKLAGRGVPDIAGNASPYSGVFLKTRDNNSSSPTFGQTVTLQQGGTSMTVPMYAGMIAVINTKLGKNVGFLNPVLYQLGNARSSVFRDITSGTDSSGLASATGNGGHQGVIGYSVTSGWDACTGWGVINAGSLLTYLQNSTTPPPPTPPTPTPPTSNPIILLSIVVSATTFSSSLPVGSAVATISVTTAGGSFDTTLGTITNILATNSGPSLSVVNNTNLVIVNSPFTSGTYTAQFTATLPGSIGSPLTSSLIQFTVTAAVTPPTPPPVPPTPPPTPPVPPTPTPPTPTPTPTGFSDPITYKVSSSSTSTGPWTTVPNSPFPNLNAAVTGLSPSTIYYFQIVPQDTLFSITGTPFVLGPVRTNAPALTQLSSHGTVLSSTSGAIVDTGLNVWHLNQSTITNELQVYINSNLIPTNSNVLSLLFWNGQIYYSTFANEWFVYNGVGWSITPGDPQITESANGLTVADPGRFILDGNSNLWSLFKTASPWYQVTQNGLVDVNTTNVILLKYYQHKVYLQRSDLSWSSWNGSSWDTTADPQSLINVPSPNGTTLSSTQGIIVDTSLNVWSLVPNTSGTEQKISLNGVVDADTHRIQNLLYWKDVLYSKASNGNWSFWNGNVWAFARGDPRSSPITWNITDKSINILLTNNFLTATSIDAFSQSVRSTVGYSSGAYYFEITGDIVTPGFVVGVSTSMYYLSGPTDLGNDATGVGFHCVYPPQSVFTGANAPKQIGIGVDIAGDVISCAVNFDTQLIWFSSPAMRAQGATWNNVSAANPGTGVGGIPFSIGTGPYFVTFSDNVGGAVATANFGASPFTIPLPAGFLAWSSEAGSANMVNNPTFVEEFD